MDLSDLKSVEQCIQQLNDEAQVIDVLINNAGIMTFDGTRGQSAQGHEIMWATNHLGHFAFTAGILSLLEKAEQPRIVTVSSMVISVAAHPGLNMTPNYMSDLLRKQTGTSALELIHQQLIEKFKCRLLNSDDSIATIAYQLGFEYPQYFCRIFKKKTSMSPQEFRQSH